MQSELRGILTPVLTPIEDGAVAIERIADSVKFAQRCGCHGIIAAGTGVQETVSLTVAERKKVISKTIDATDERPVLAGISHPSLQIATELATHAAEEGADGVLAMPPWGFAPDDDVVMSYYRSIDASTELPILLYNNPTVTVDLAPETMRRIARLDGVKYVKETSRNWKKLAWLIENVDDAGLASVFGTMDVLLPVLEAGGRGAVIPAPANAPAMRVYDAFNESDSGAALEAQRTFVDFPPDEVSTGLMPAVKAASELSGVPVGPPRPPYQPVSEEGKDAISEWLAREDVPTVE
ncbi:dihydrodipicolinate synthase family protein [Natrarchaeobius oligotrophus]|uniref:Dihydrodipicolinate synthase family protein n=1 Tax=Natrarchaeobius chitinivorans TaxID=1679083 RepID=A0A3N6N127_NATCH|nr:dihydrodipicolinate synthase family protein [Natrarchaeobius chitinivorans]RQH02552.1 dihydrodipicolinate synthase family protein [Natrarchaeobius chitinivorans]